VSECAIHTMNLFSDVDILVAPRPGSLVRTFSPHAVRLDEDVIVISPHFEKSRPAALCTVWYRTSVPVYQPVCMGKQCTIADFWYVPGNFLVHVTFEPSICTFALCDAPAPRRRINLYPTAWEESLRDRRVMDG